MIGEILKTGRLKKKMSQDELASKIGVHKQSIFRWENNRAIPDGIALIKIAQELDIVNEIFQKQEQKPTAISDEIRIIFPKSSQEASIQDEIRVMGKKQEQLEKTLEIIAKKLNISINLNGNGNFVGNSSIIAGNNNSAKI